MRLGEGAIEEGSPPSLSLPVVSEASPELAPSASPTLASPSGAEESAPLQAARASRLSTGQLTRIAPPLDTARRPLRVASRAHGPGVRAASPKAAPTATRVPCAPLCDTV